MVEGLVVEWSGYNYSFGRFGNWNGIVEFPIAVAVSKTFRLILGGSTLLR